MPPKTLSKPTTSTPPPFLSSTSLPVPSQDRLAALWAFTRVQREANPAGYASNVRWWEGALAAHLSAGGEGDTLVLKVSDTLLGRLASAGGVRPKGIAGVIDTLTTPTGPFIPSTRFLDSPTPIEATPGIASRIVGAAVGAGWGLLARVNPFGGEPTEEGLWKGMKGKEFVYLPNVKNAAAAFEAHVTDNPPINYTDALYTRASFLKEFGTVTEKAALSKRDVDILLRWLSRDAGLVVVDGDVIKLLTAGQIPADHPITEADRGALSVLSTLSRIEAQIEAVEKQAQECQQKAKRQLALGQRASAASYLRSKKQLDDVLGKRIAAGEQLRAVVRALDQAKGDAEVMSAYEASTAALASALADPRLSADRIAATTDALADALADQKEIDDAVQLGGRLAVDMPDEDELEKELAALVLEDKEEKERAAKAKAEVEAAARAEAAKAKAEADAQKAAAAAAKPPTPELSPAEAAAKAQKDAEARIAALSASAAPSAAASWDTIHADAQERERAEKARAEAERLKKEEQMLVAE